MSFKAKLFLGRREYMIKNVNYSLQQETDATGRPSTIVRGGKIHVTVTYARDTYLFETMANNFEQVDGSVMYYRRDNDAVLKELFFTDAYIIKYSERFRHRGRLSFYQTILLSAREIQMGQGVHSNQWR